MKAAGTVSATEGEPVKETDGESDHVLKAKASGLLATFFNNSDGV